MEKKMFLFLFVLIFFSCEKSSNSNFDFPKTFIRTTAEKVTTVYYIVDSDTPQSSTDITNSLDVSTSILDVGNMELSDLLTSGFEFLSPFDIFEFLSEDMVKISIYDGSSFVLDTTVSYLNSNSTYTIPDFANGNINLEYNSANSSMNYPLTALWGVPQGSTDIDDITQVFMFTPTSNSDFVDNINTAISVLGLQTGDSLAIANCRVVYE